MINKAIKKAVEQGQYKYDGLEDQTLIEFKFVEDDATVTGSYVSFIYPTYFERLCYYEIAADPEFWKAFVRSLGDAPAEQINLMARTLYNNYHMAMWDNCAEDFWAEHLPGENE